MSAQAATDCGQVANPAVLSIAEVLEFVASNRGGLTSQTLPYRISAQTLSSAVGGNKPKEFSQSANSHRLDIPALGWSDWYHPIKKLLTVPTVVSVSVSPRQS